MRGAPHKVLACAICLIKALNCALTFGRPGPASPEELEPLTMPDENGLRLDDQEGRTPLTPDFGKPDPEEAIAKAQLRSRMAALIDGQLLSESKILQSQALTVSECVGEYIDEGK